MTDIGRASINSLLADASYATVTGGMDAPDIIEALRKRMTPKLAEYIAKNFEVVSAVDTSDVPFIGSGFDAVVWRGRSGTEPGRVNDPRMNSMGLSIHKMAGYALGATRPTLRA